MPSHPDINPSFSPSHDDRLSKRGRIFVNKDDPDSTLWMYTTKGMNHVFRREKMQNPISLNLLVGLSKGRIPFEIINPKEICNLCLGQSNCIPVEYVLRRKNGEPRAEGLDSETNVPDKPFGHKPYVLTYFSGMTVDSFLSENQLRKEFYTSGYPELSVENIISVLTHYLTEDQKNAPVWQKFSTAQKNQGLTQLEQLKTYSLTLSLIQTLHSQAQETEARKRLFACFISLSTFISKLQLNFLKISHFHPHTKNFLFRFVDRKLYQEQLKRGDCINTNTLQITPESVRFDPSLAESPTLFEDYIVETPLIDWDVAFVNVEHGDQDELELASRIETTKLSDFLTSGDPTKEILAAMYLPDTTLLNKLAIITRLSPPSQRIISNRFLGYFRRATMQERKQIRQYFKTKPQVISTVEFKHYFKQEIMAINHPSLFLLYKVRSYLQAHGLLN